jgi:Spy/CpxP family protein refolding chaperone
MTNSLRWKLIAAFVLVFLAGAIAGQLLVIPRMHRMFPGHMHSDALKEHMREHLQRELNLTSQQLEQMAPIIDRTAAKLEAIRVETNQKVGETFAEQRQQFASFLTPEQQEKLQTMEHRHRHQIERHRFHHSHSRRERETSPITDPDPD